jgi:DeoR family ulaG and ulaABCDEF operon transcriptional repressor
MIPGIDARGRLGAPPMHQSQRRRAILKQVAESQVVSVRALAEGLGVSEPTIRRDIHDMAQAGQLRKVHGGAEALSPDPPANLATRPFRIRQTLNIDKKRAIAREACRLARDGESIIINGGTTTCAMVDFLIDRHLTIMTNSLAIAEPLIRGSANRIMLPGGEVYREQNIVLSPFDNDTIPSHYAAKMFMSCFGIGPLGVMEGDPLLVRSEQKLLAQAEELILLIDSGKFHLRGSLIVCPLARITTLITDDGADPAALAMLRDAGIRTVVVPVPAAESSAA